MGVLTDIRSGKTDRHGLGGYAIVFWSMAGLAAGGGLGAWPGWRIGEASLSFGLAGFGIGLCLGFYAAFGATRMARMMALPGAVVAIIGMLAGSQ